MNVPSNLAGRIEATTDTDKVVETTLKTSERVLARVTDGIYRQPGSALRELVSNAYDADATRVVIGTDRPRFSEITIEDDGAGMTPSTLAHLIENIGGSAKRRAEGAELGITDSGDPLKSPKGRLLIGRIGIGLFSVSQLTQSFQIVTKVAGDSHRTVATVVMRQYGESAGPGSEEDEEYEAGKVRVWREPASDEPSHGTTIVLDGIRPQTRRTLQSDAIWAAIEQAELGDDDLRVPDPPRYHIGRVLPGTDDELRTAGSELFDSVPWSSRDTPETAFGLLVDSVWDAIGEGSTNPKLATLFDEYLQMVWQLALAIPLPYVDGHPFGIPFGTDAYTYALGAGRSGSPEEVVLQEGETFAEKCGLRIRDGDSEEPFQVLLDDLELSRPLRFRRLPKTAHALKRSIMLVGKCREEFAGVPIQLSGGPLEFEAYLLWNPKIAPTEHQGSLIRIHGASGTLFDPSFMRYQISEQTRRQQTSCEIFVSAGLEGALNIDRESFNFAHPHVVFLTAWLHNALRRLATTQKGLAASVRDQARKAAEQERASRLDQITQQAWSTATDDEDVVPPFVELLYRGNSPDQGDRPAEREVLTLRADEVVPTDLTRPQLDKTEPRIAAIASILAAFGVLDALPASQFDQLLAALIEVLVVDES